MDESPGFLHACVLRTIFACPVLHTCPVVTGLAESMLRRMATPQEELSTTAGAPPSGTSGPQGGVELSEGSSPALLVPVSGNGTAEARPAAAPSADASEAPALPIPTALRYAVAAAEGLEEQTLLSLAEHCAAGKRPLAVAFALERLRLMTSMLDKAPWQLLATQVRASA